jgi:superfamily II DNA/RNA helicase
VRACWSCVRTRATDDRNDRWPALAIHGDKGQAERDWVLAEFKAGKAPVMIATDVAARGLGNALRCRVVVLVCMC